MDFPQELISEQRGWLFGSLANLWSFGRTRCHEECSCVLRERRRASRTPAEHSHWRHTRRRPENRRPHRFRSIPLSSMDSGFSINLGRTWIAGVWAGLTRMEEASLLLKETETPPG